MKVVKSPFRYHIIVKKEDLPRDGIFEWLGVKCLAFVLHGAGCGTVPHYHIYIDFGKDVRHSRQKMISVFEECEGVYISPFQGSFEDFVRYVAKSSDDFGVTIRTNSI